MVVQPGTYVIKLLNSSSNWHIAEILNEKMDHLYALTFTVAAEKVQQTGRTVLTFYEGNGGRPQAMKKWFWPGDTIGQEFVDPKNQAAGHVLRKKVLSGLNHEYWLEKIAA